MYYSSSDKSLLYKDKSVKIELAKANYFLKSHELYKFIFTDMANSETEKYTSNGKICTRYGPRVRGIQNEFKVKLRNNNI